MNHPTFISLKSVTLSELFISVENSIISNLLLLFSDLGSAVCLIIFADSNFGEINFLNTMNIRKLHWI
jgi:hypothetical protein